MSNKNLKQFFPGVHEREKIYIFAICKVVEKHEKKSQQNDEVFERMDDRSRKRFEKRAIHNERVQTKNWKENKWEFSQFFFIEKATKKLITNHKQNDDWY